MRIAAPTAARMIFHSCLLLLCLARAAAVCPASWSESPAGGCYRLTDESATHWGCAELCGPEASLACISSEEESAYVSMELNPATFLTTTISPPLPTTQRDGAICFHADGREPRGH